MGTRTLADIAPTAATIALNAYIFGYGGHSLVTPHAALKRLWWTEERINAKITRPFVISKLRGQEREFLDRALAFGEGLTDDTYMEWILNRAKRLFLILTEIGIPDQIFGCIDDSWDDDDLPVSFENVRSLELAYEDDEALNKKFYDTQYLYLLRELKSGKHIDYGPNERIPMEYVNTLPPAASIQLWDRIHFPGRPDDVYVRRKFKLSDADGNDLEYNTFRKDVKRAQTLAHEHIAPIWASYTSDKSAYVVSDFVGEHTLGTYIDHRTAHQYLRVSETERPVLLCEWMHCLADALASLHHRGIAHTGIRPSNILINRDNNIAFADVGTIRTLQKGKKISKAEIYDYAPPESQICRTPMSISSSPPVSSIFSFQKLRKFSSSSSSSSGSIRSSVGRDSFCTAPTSPSSPCCASPSRTDSMTTIMTAVSHQQSPTASRNFSRHFRNVSSSSTISIPLPPSPVNTMATATTIRTFPPPTILDPEHLTDLPRATAEMSDIFSLGCIYLDILTFLLLGKRTEFIAFRTTTHGTPPSRSPATRSKPKKDTSFHFAPELISAWIDRLITESTTHTDQAIYNCIPSLLSLIRRMMSQNALLRPTARDVRDKIHDILAHEGDVTTLCCAGREWDTNPLDTLSRKGSAIDLHQPRRGSESVRPMSSRTVMKVENELPFGPIESKKHRRQSSAGAAVGAVVDWGRRFTRST